MKQADSFGICQPCQQWQLPVSLFNVMFTHLLSVNLNIHNMGTKKQQCVFVFLGLNEMTSAENVTPFSKIFCCKKYF